MIITNLLLPLGHISNIYHPKDNDLSLSLIVMLTEHFLLGYLGKLSIPASGIKGERVPK